MRNGALTLARTQRRVSTLISRTHVTDMLRFRSTPGSSPGPGSVSWASNSQQAMWETAHQQVSVKSAAGSQTRCLLPLPLSRSLSARLLIDSQSISAFRRRCEPVHCPRGSSFEMRRWADTEPADPDVAIWSARPHKPLGRFICTSILTGKVLVKAWMSRAHANRPVWLRGVDSRPSGAIGWRSHLKACPQICFQLQKNSHYNI